MKFLVTFLAMFTALPFAIAADMAHIEALTKMEASETLVKNMAEHGYSLVGIKEVGSCSGQFGARDCKRYGIIFKHPDISDERVFDSFLVFTTEGKVRVFVLE